MKKGQKLESKLQLKITPYPYILSLQYEQFAFISFEKKQKPTRFKPWNVLGTLETTMTTTNILTVTRKSTSKENPSRT